MESDAPKDQILKTYLREYARKLPLTRKQKFFAFPAGLFLGMSPWAIVGGAIAGICGVAVAPAIVSAGILAFVLGVGFAAQTVIMSNENARQAIERDIDNGTLTTRYRKEFQAPEAASAPGSSLDGGGVKAAFNAPVAANDSSASSAPSTVPAIKPKP